VHALELEGSPDLHLVAGSTPQRPHLPLELATRLRREQQAQLLESVIAGAVDHVVVLARDDPGRGLAGETHLAPVPRRRNVRDAAGDQAKLLVVGERRHAIGTEHAAIGALDEVTARGHAQRGPVDVVGPRVDAVLQEALQARRRQVRRVDRQSRVRAARANELDAAERALPAAHDRDLRALLARDPRNLHASALAVEHAAGRLGVDGEPALSALAGERERLARIAQRSRGAVHVDQPAVSLLGERHVHDPAGHDFDALRGSREDPGEIRAEHPSLHGG